MSCTFIHIISSFVHRIYSRTSLIIAVCSIIIFSFSGCKTYDNGTTYFNTYYNMNRLLWESEYDFEGSEILKRQKNEKEYMEIADFIIKNDETHLVLPQVLKIIDTLFSVN